MSFSRISEASRAWPRRDLIVVGASAGGIEALHIVLPMLPADLPAAGMIVVHRAPAKAPFDRLAQVLSFGASISLSIANNGQAIEQSHFYLAPTGSHLLVGRGVMRLEESPKESFQRPSADALFRSAAAIYGRRVIGVILTGLGAEGQRRSLADPEPRRRHDGAGAEGSSVPVHAGERHRKRRD